MFILILNGFIQASNENLEKVSLQLNWRYQFEFAGFIAAKEKGFYKNLGLDVELREFTNETSVIDEVMTQKADFGVYDASLLRSHSKEKPLVLLSNYFKRSALVFITKQNILTPEDLIGKKVMASNKELEQSSLGTLLKKFSIEPNTMDLYTHSYSAKEFINGSVDAMTAYISNELYEIKKSNTPYNIIDPVNYGIYGLGLNLFTTLDKTEKQKQQVENFINASNKGWQYALSHKKELVDIIYNKYSKIKSKEALLFEAKETEKLIIPSVYPVGFIDKKIVQNAINSLYAQGLIRDDIKVDQLVYSSGTSSKKQSIFNQKQQDYIKKKKLITMCIDPNWMPYERINNGKHEGITSEYIKLFEKRMGIPFKLIETKTWSQSLEYIKARTCDILALASKTASREKYMNFSEAYLNFPIVIATKVDKLFITDIKKIITSEKVGIVKGYALGEILKEEHPKHKIVDVNSVEEGMELVSKGELFGFLDAMPPIAYVLQDKYISDLKIAGKFKNTYIMSVGVRSDDLMLLEVLNNVISTISASKKQEILNKYISVKFERGFDYELFWQVSVLLVLLVSYGLYRHKELIATKNKLQNSIESFEVLLDCVMEAIFVYENGVCIDVNNVAVEMFGYQSKEQMIGRKVNDFVDSATLKLVEKNFHKNVNPYEVLAKKSSGESFNVLVQGRNSIINNKEVRIATIVDVTDMKNQEKLLLQQSKLAAMGEMIENIAHQWRQPLSLISTSSTGLELKLEFDTFKKEEALVELQNINETTQHLSQTIDDFRNFFRSNKEKKDFFILRLIQRNLSLFDGMFKNGRITIILENNEDILINNYENELTQALLNIFYNARDAMMGQKEKKYIFIELIKEEKIVSLYIKDNGGGIDEKIITKIFDPYFTTKHRSQGTGIGLYMTHQIIEQHMKGHIEVSNVTYTYNNQKCNGAQFKIQLPL